MSYKKFRESKKEYFVTKEGTLTKKEITKKLEAWMIQRLGDQQDFLDKYEVKE